MLKPSSINLESKTLFPQFISQHFRNFMGKFTSHLRSSFFNKPFFLECKNRKPAPRNTSLTVSSQISFLTPALTLNRLIVKHPYCSRSMDIWRIISRLSRGEMLIGLP